MRALICLTLLALGGCAPYLEANLVQNFSRQGGNDVAWFEAGGERRLGDRLTGHCAYYHASNPSRGVPFNTKTDLTLLDGVGCGIRYGGVR